MKGRNKTKRNNAESEHRLDVSTSSRRETNFSEKLAATEHVLVRVAGLSLLGLTIARLWCGELHGLSEQIVELWKAISAGIAP